MNLMFRKNFRAEKSFGGGGGGKHGGKGNAGRNMGKRSREHGYSGVEEHHYRTHIFFSPARSSFQPDYEEPRCGPVTGAASSLTVSAMSPSDVDMPQPLVDRRSSVSLLKWTPSVRRNTSSDLATPCATRQVSFSGGSTSTSLMTNAQPRSEPISLATLDKDCFIIPVHSLDRFLPAGVPNVQLPVPSPTASVTERSSASPGPLSVLEVADPKLCVLAHLMSPLEPIDPLLESPLAHPLFKQRTAASELLTEVQQTNTALSGMLLANMERNAEFPFISYYVINTQQNDPALFYSNLRSASLSKFEPRVLSNCQNQAWVDRYTAAHTLDLYCEVAAICRPPLRDVSAVKRAHTPTTGYIISVYKVFEGDDGERFERNWLYWTGARMLYRYLPRAAGLRRIALHKSVSSRGDKMYLLVCECAHLLQDLTAAALLVPALRARLCGYTGLYRPIQTF